MMKIINAWHYFIYNMRNFRNKMRKYFTEMAFFTLKSLVVGRKSVTITYF